MNLSISIILRNPKSISMVELLSLVHNELKFPIDNPVLIFAILLLIILLSPILLKRFNVPSIIGWIIAGVIIGPYGLNWIDNNNAGVEFFSTIGLLYIMFIVGLEHDFNEFIKNRNKSLTYVFFTFIHPIII
jgi:Kef-type K+ transport system membrane component KefB